MSMEGPRSKESRPAPEAEIFDPSEESWDSVREEILRLDRLCFGDKSFSEEELRASFENPEHIVVLLRQLERIIGFSSAAPDEDAEGALYIDTTDILPEEQGKGHVVTLMKLLEAEARRRGYAFLTRNAARENGYADKIQKNYADRIVETYENDSEYGPQQYFKIRL